MKQAACKREGIPFDFDHLMSLECPDVCPRLRTPISFVMGEGHRDAEFVASFDRIDPKKGYVRDNVRIISLLANQMNSNGTPEQRRNNALGELADQADWFARFHKRNQ